MSDDSAAPADEAFTCAGCDKPALMPPATTFMGLKIGPCCAPGLNALRAAVRRGDVALDIEVR